MQNAAPLSIISSSFLEVSTATVFNPALTADSRPEKLSSKAKHALDGIESRLSPVLSTNAHDVRDDTLQLGKTR